MACSKGKRLKTGVVIFAAAGVLLFGACSGQGLEKGTTYVSLTKEGTVKSYINESFGQSYYDEAELQQVILSRVASYNREAGSGNITVDKVKVESARATVEMTYQKAADYAAFNENIFFAGTPQEAQEAGYDLNVVLSSVKDSMVTVGKADILSMEKVRLLITDISDPIKLSGKALYIGEQVWVSDNHKTVGLLEDAAGLAYVLYQ